MTTTEEKTFFAAIDLGSSKITGVVATKTDDGKINIIACEEAESKYIRRGEIKNVSDTAFQISNIVKKLENNVALREAKAEIKKIYVGLGGQTLKTTTNKVKRLVGGDDITATLLGDMLDENRKIRIENNEIYEIIPQEYLVDDEFEFDPEGMTCSHLQGMYKIICGKPELRYSLQRSFEKTNLETAMYIAPIATAEAALTQKDKEMGCAVIDFGAETTSVCVYFNGYLRHLAVIPFGGNVITNDIKDLNLTQAVSEKLKIKFGNAVSDLETDTTRYIVIPAENDETEEQKISTFFLSSIIEARASEILDIVWGEIEKSKFATRLGSGIVITGGGSKLNNLNELIKLKTGCNVRYATVSRHIAEESNPKYKDFGNAHIAGLLLLAEESCTKAKEPIVPEGGSGKKNNKKGENEGGKKENGIINWLETLFDVNSDPKM